MATKNDFTFEPSRFGRGIGSSAEVHLLEEKNAVCEEAYSKDNLDGTEVCEEEREKIPVKSPAQTPSQSPAKTTPMAPSSSSTPAKLETLVKEFATAKSNVDLPHRGKPHEWTIAHWRKAFGQSDKDDECRIVWDTSVARLTVPEGVNPEELFSEKRPEKDKNGYKTRSYKDPLRRVLAESLMALFCPARMMYLVTHKVAFIERVVRKEKINWGAVFAQHVLHSLKTVNDGNPVYVGAFLIVGDYSSDEDDSSSDEEHQAVAPLVLAKDTEDEDEEDEGIPRPRGVHFSFDDATRRPKSSTSPNYSPLPTPQPKTKKRMCGEVSRAKKALRIGHEDTAKNREGNEDEESDEERDKGKQLLEEGVEVEIQEQGGGSASGKSTEA
ncbi:hypothetical protein R1sor_006133 [Riccia sorocarpa]|uniref:Uncharacterized protein n=1 Tax=Riccia sorocarpa TaxID=122646 RepID=A0ABD3HPH4_9MARC